MNLDYTIISGNQQLPIWIKGKKLAKVAILCLHGGPGNGSGPCQRSPLHQALEQEYIVIYFDQRYSKQLIPSDIQLTKKQIVDDVMAVKLEVDKLINYEQIFLLGVSFGGCLGFLTLEEHAAAFDGYIALCPAVLFSAADIQMRKASMEALICEMAQTKMSVEEFLQQRELLAKVPVWITHVIAMRHWFLAQTFTTIFTKLTIPTLIIQGEDDKLTPEPIITAGVSKTNVGQIEYKMLPSYGHNLTDNQQGDIDQYINTFIRKNAKLARD
ncbi:MAG: alpha/beta hydrolase family protein [Culicoidibacterales bacterium]